MQYLLRSLMIAGARLSQVNLPGRAVEQAYTQVLLKLGNVLADQLWGHVQLVGSAGEGAFIHHRNEGAHGIDTIHNFILAL